MKSTRLEIQARYATLTPKELERRLKDNEYARLYYQRNRERAKLESAEWRERNAEKLREYSRKWKKANRDQVREAAHRYKCGRQRENLRTIVGRLKSLIYGARKRAKDSGLIFEESLAQHLLSNLPTRCACCLSVFDLDLRESGASGPNRRSMSLDRFDPRLGYTIANTKVVCFRCNTIKSDATLTELSMVVAYLKKGAKGTK